jgi:hypothetical protein
VGVEERCEEAVSHIPVVRRPTWRNEALGCRAPRLASFSLQHGGCCAVASNGAAWLVRNTGGARALAQLEMGGLSRSLTTVACGGSGMEKIEELSSQIT